MLRPGNAGSNTAADHIEAARLALAKLPCRLRQKVLVRADSGCGTHEFLTWLTARSRRLHYSVGMTITEAIAHAIGKVPAAAWTPAYDGDGQVRNGAWVADITGRLDLDGWPAGMRVIVRKERPHPGAQLRFTDIDGHRFTAFATDTKKGQLADLELRPPRLPGCRPFHPADQPELSLRPGRRIPRARGTPPTRRDSRAIRHGTPLKISPKPAPQPATSRLAASPFRSFQTLVCGPHLSL